MLMIQEQNEWKKSIQYYTIKLIGWRKIQYTNDKRWIN